MKKTLLGESIIFTLKDGTNVYMKVLRETKDFYTGFDVERMNFALSKDKIEEYRRVGDKKIVKFNEVE